MQKSSIIPYETYCENYDPTKYKSTNLMTIYEYTNIIGVRLEQLAFGAPSLLEDGVVNSLKDIKLIAVEELRQNKIPLLISRTMPNGDKEIWKTEDLIIID